MPNINTSGPPITNVNKLKLFGVDENKEVGWIFSNSLAPVADYAADIEITQYNQLVRDENGEFWRVSGQVDLPYVTTGAGIPEDDALVPVGDAVLRQDLANPGMGAAMVGYRGRAVFDRLSDELSIVDFYADPTGSADSSYAIEAAVQECLATGAKLTARGVFRISGPVNLRNVRVDFTNATIVLDGSAPPLVIGGNAASSINPKQQFKRVYRDGGASTEPTLRVAGTKDQTFHVDSCDYMQIYADTAAPDENRNGSVAYCTFNLGKIGRLELTNNPSNTGDEPGAGGRIQWINENTFNLQRCSGLSISGTYNHNHNRFYGGTFESGSVIDLRAGWDNKFYDIRFESGGEVKFYAGTERNTIIKTWDSSRAGFQQGPIVSQGGVENVVINDFFLYHNAEIVAALDLSDPVTDTQATSQSTRDVSLQKIMGRSLGGPLASSGFVPVDVGDVFRWVNFNAAGAMGADDARYRCSIEFYDASLRPVPAGVDFIYSNGGVLSVVDGNRIYSGTNVAGATATIEPPAIAAGVAFVKVLWAPNSPITSSISNAIVMRIIRWCPRSSFKFGQSLPQLGNTATGIPTRGFAPVGFSLINPSASERYVCTYALDVQSNSVNPEYSEILSFNSGEGLDGVNNGDIVGVNLDNGETHWSTVASGGGTVNITLSNALPTASRLGSRVVFGRWIAQPL